MERRNRLGLYGSYFLGMSGIGFTLPFLPLFLGEHGMSDRAIGIVSTLAALAGLAQFPIGVWSDHVGRRKPFLIGILGILALATILLPFARGTLLLGILVLFFAENGLCRATVESLAGAEATHLAAPGQVGKALGALRFWRPVSIILVAIGGGIIAETLGIDAILWPLAALQILAVVAVLIVRDEPSVALSPQDPQEIKAGPPVGRGFRDPVLWIFVAAMVLFHVANAPGGVYLGLYLKRDLHAPERYLSYAFVVSMIAWMLAVRLVGRVADRFGRKPFLILGWALVSLRLALIAIATTAEQILAIQVLDGLAQSLFAVAAAAWVTDRLADPRRVGEAQVLVGSSLVFGSAVGPLLSALVVESTGYVGMFGLLAGIGAIGLVLVIAFVPETMSRPRTDESLVEPSELRQEEAVR
ncbi:MAG TPA: MFS transporter [Gemmataceae bacterium]|jgi:MFS family permease|nr:MFS transporter [Gemmataceae bacterium]